MDIQGEKILTVARAEVWRALNDAAVLQRCLPGCDTFASDGEHKFRVALQASVGPVRARFTGKLELRDVVPPSSYAIVFEGSGGVAGFGKGTAQVVLEDVAQGTRLRYGCQAQVGGRLAQVGARLIDGVTQRMADDFFDRFVRELGKQQAPVVEPIGTPPAAEAVEPPAMTAPQPGQPAQPAALPPQAVPSPQSTQIAVIAAAVSATAAAVAVLAALFTLQFAR